MSEEAINPQEEYINLRNYIRDMQTGMLFQQVPCMIILSNTAQDITDPQYNLENYYKFNTSDVGHFHSFLTSIKFNKNVENYIKSNMPLLNEADSETGRTKAFQYFQDNEKQLKPFFMNLIEYMINQHNETLHLPYNKLIYFQGCTCTNLHLFDIQKLHEVSKNNAEIVFKDIKRNPLITKNLNYTLFSRISQIGNVMLYDMSYANKNTEPTDEEKIFYATLNVLLGENDEINIGYNKRDYIRYILNTPKEQLKDEDITILNEIKSPEFRTSIINYGKSWLENTNLNLDNIKEGKPKLTPYQLEALINFPESVLNSDLIEIRDYILKEISVQDNDYQKAPF